MYISNKTKCFSYKDSFITNVMLLEGVSYTTKKQRISLLSNHVMCDCGIVLFYFALLHSCVTFCKGLLLPIIPPLYVVSLYHYCHWTFTQYNTCGVWFLDINLLLVTPDLASVKRAVNFHPQLYHSKVNDFSIYSGTVC